MLARNEPLGSTGLMATSAQVEFLMAQVSDLANENRKLVESVHNLRGDIELLRWELDTGMGVLGHAGATGIKNRVAYVAMLRSPNDAAKRLKENGKIQNKLREACRWPSCEEHSWENLPRNQAWKVKVKLDQYEADALRIARARMAGQQLSLGDLSAPRKLSAGSKQ